MMLKSIHLYKNYVEKPIEELARNDSHFIYNINYIKIK